jgi:hypothetical protein
VDAPTWPFIVARNPSLDWRPICVPDFLAESRCEFVLVTETPEPPSDGTVRVRQIELSTAGSLTIVYRAKHAAYYLPEQLIDGRAADRFGRPINVVEGLVYRGKFALEDDCIAHQMDDASRLAESAIPAFWFVEDEDVEPVITQQISSRSEEFVASQASVSSSSGAASEPGSKTVRLGASIEKRSLTSALRLFFRTVLKVGRREQARGGD